MQTKAKPEVVIFDISHIVPQKTKTINVFSAAQTYHSIKSRLNQFLAYKSSQTSTDISLHVALIIAVFR
jgi:hypothetical protein